MRRLVLLLVTLVLFAGAIWLWNRDHTKRKERAWLPLAKGGEICLVKVTHGTTHSIETGPRMGWHERIAAARGARSLGPLFNPPPPPTSTTSSGKPSLCLWFQIRGRGKEFVHAWDPELVLADGQHFRIGSSGSSNNSNGISYLHVILPVIPTHERQLRFAGKYDGERLEFTFDNPAFGTAPATWRAEPLPQSKTNGRISLTLRSLTLQPPSVVFSDNSGSRVADDWVPRAAWKIRHDGEEADNWYSVSVEFADESGNAIYRTGILSEPVWRLRSTLVRTNRFPFQEGDITWLGMVDPARAAALAPEQYELFMPPGSSGAVKLAGLFGKGIFDVSAAGVGKTAPAEGKRPMTKYDATAKLVKMDLTDPAFVVLADGGRDVQVFRDNEGNIASLDERWSHGGPHGRLAIYKLPPKPLRFGIASPQPVVFDFYVKPPQKPPP